MKKILFIIGSLRAKSFNRQMADVAKEIIGNRAVVEELDYSDLPLLNQDIEQPEPDVVARVRKAVSEADALWIFTPEYNFSYPGHLKNLLDWMSRPVKPMDYATPTCINGKRVAISGAGGQAATANCRAKLTDLLTFIKADVLPEQTGVAVPGEAWGTDVLVLTDEQKAQLKAQADKLVESTRKRKGHTEITEITEIPIEHHPLEPFLPKNARLLMLGSFPPPRKRWCMEFFYPNRTNMMWEIFGEVFFGDSQRLVDAEQKTFRLEEIQALLNGKGIAIFDTASAVRRISGNASDTDLRIVEKTDIPSLLERIPLCHDIVCTGRKSFSVLTEDYVVEMPQIGTYNEFGINGRQMRLWRMPSSSRAYPMPLKEKAAYYKQMMDQVFGG